ncbi:hypothetical protein PSACC_00623 [Paramicrosporidium saccamoebae]|uniref:Uncharacterized protein n=1 Tax=Paramicrosporidium saccamoebae TaxID=1246581 RepID=A0A2H9TPB2_9FUNG|nr:hypothetical protein PSACC_00623 [Paramicrosporidium saccamoebae]
MYTTDREEVKLKKSINALYTRVLELTDQILSLQESRVELARERELLTDQNWTQEKQLSVLHEHLNTATLRRQDCLTRIAELEETTSTLTEWNSSLEQQCDTLTVSLRQYQQVTGQSIKELQDDLLTATKKQIHQQGEVDLLDEENTLLRRALREAQDIQDRLVQENAILKSKMYNMCMSRDTPLSLRTTSPELIPKMENVKLDSNLGIGEILQHLKLQIRD